MKVHVVMFATNHDIETRSEAERTAAYRPVERSGSPTEVTTC